MDDNRINLPSTNVFRHYSAEDAIVIPADAPVGDFNQFITGYFSDRLRAGDRPDRGYPASPLPRVSPDAVMEIETGFMKALKNTP